MPTLIYTKHGWVSNTSQFTTDRAEARRYPSMLDAIQQCQRMYAGGTVAVPVTEEDIGFMK